MSLAFLFAMALLVVCRSQGVNIGLIAMIGN